MKSTIEKKFTGYEWFVVALLTFLQFTVVLDFMVLAPMSGILLEELQISTAQFGWVVSAYAFSAGASAFLASGFADRFDRKRLLIFFYSGFILGTLFCGLANSYAALLVARIVTGIFGGVMSSISFAIITDLFSFQRRGKVMGFVQMAFSSSQVFGIPLGLYLANKFNWHIPFMLIVSISSLVWIVAAINMKPITEHLKIKSKKNAFSHMKSVLSNRNYLQAFSVTTILATGGFMLMPLGAAFSEHNLGIPRENIMWIYMVTGAFSMAMGPIAGKLADKFGKFRLFIIGSFIAAAVIAFYCNLGTTPLYLVILLNIIMFAGITSRMVSNQALISAVPEPADRGAFMGINSSVMQVSGGIAAAIAGLIVVQTDTGFLDHYDILGYVVTASIFASILLMRRINTFVMKKEGDNQQKEQDLRSMVETDIHIPGPASVGEAASAKG